jgi:hypothetical protein
LRLQVIVGIKAATLAVIQRFAGPMALFQKKTRNDTAFPVFSAAPLAGWIAAVHCVASVAAPWLTDDPCLLLE